jgi:hypothetical protein
MLLLKPHCAWLQVSQALSAMASLGKAMGGSISGGAGSSMVGMVQAGLSAALSSGKGFTAGQATDTLQVLDTGSAAIGKGAALTGAPVACCYWHMWTHLFCKCVTGYPLLQWPSFPNIGIRLW